MSFKWIITAKNIMVAYNMILLHYTYAIHSSEYLPGFAQLHDLLRSCAHWVETSIHRHSKKQHSPQVQWSNPWPKEDNWLPLFTINSDEFSKCHRPIWMHHSLCSFHQCFVRYDIILSYLPTQISKADIKFMLLTGLLLFTCVIIWKVTVILIMKVESNACLAFCLSH